MGQANKPSEEAEWYFKSDGKSQGPVSKAMLRKLASKGTIKPGTPVKRGANGQWKKASLLKGLFSGTSSNSARKTKSRSAGNAKSSVGRPPWLIPSAIAGGFVLVVVIGVVVFMTVGNSAESETPVSELGLDGLKEQLADENNVERRRAAFEELITRKPTADVVLTICSKLDDNDESVRKIAERTIQTNLNDVLTLDCLVLSFEKSPGVRRLLKQSKDKVLPGYLKRFKETGRVSIINVLAEIAPDSLVVGIAILNELDKTRPKTRRVSISKSVTTERTGYREKLLAFVPKLDRAVIAAVLQRMKKTSRGGIAFLPDICRAIPTTAARRFCEVLQSGSDEYDLVWILNSLQHVGPIDSRMIPLLEKIVFSAERMRQERNAAVLALASFVKKYNSIESAAVLKKALESDDELAKGLASSAVSLMKLMIR